MERCGSFGTPRVTFHDQIGYTSCMIREIIVEEAREIGMQVS